MNFKLTGLLIATMATAAIGVSGSAFAFCGVIEKTAKGPTAAAATHKANNAGLVAVRSLEKSVGAGKVKYEKAKVTCVGGGVAMASNGKVTKSQIECTITQSFCANQ